MGSKFFFAVFTDFIRMYCESLWVIIRSNSPSLIADICFNISQMTAGQIPMLAKGICK